MTTTTRFPETRHASFSWKKAVKPVTSFISGIFWSVAEAKRKSAAMEVALVLKDNQDFKHMSVIDIYQRILDDTSVKS